MELVELVERVFGAVEIEARGAQAEHRDDKPRDMVPA